MKTEHTEHVGKLRLVLRSDGGIYLGEPDQYGIMDDAIRIGTSSAICSALASAATSMAQHIRGERMPGLAELTRMMNAHAGMVATLPVGWKLEFHP